MFYDQAKIYVKAGDGGAGAVAFRREKYVPEGGPSGGDGGRGGNVVFIGDEGLRTLVDFRYKRHYKGDRGDHGQAKNMSGRGGEDIILRIPVGTVVLDDSTGEPIADIIEHDQRVVVAAGGRGGRGNARFMSNTNKAPTLAENGEPGEERWLRLELKLLADVGLVGFPNVGKSTMISKVSAAKPKIADYHFTTLIPNLGVVDIEDGESFVMADIPGLIEGAHSGAGLGHEFLRHTERTRLILHVLDISGSEERDPLEDFRIIEEELRLYSPELALRPVIIVANKMDIPGSEENLQRLKEAVDGRNEIFSVSAAKGEGLQALIYRIAQILPDIPVPEIVSLPVDHRVTKAESDPRFEILKEEDLFIVVGKEIERHAKMTLFDREESVYRFQNIIKAMGIDDALNAAGIKEGDKVEIAGYKFDWV
ncbi:GTPase ObgE [Desulfosporosinus sp. BICA1-9]|uniref:GTPase ObgE n=1 Tax=Desulfosporosinus sp. BICA1-9 TaxID=1531958 RepID=UPI00054B8906|nr:GTPase ObgE [Desulfosporosinus sp. BICA1-9]KJS46869.1 MAG: GTPase ObgE [Peptococcaceae bacterium BRH_c23]KJS81853.1 MAG: GTPase ObgE [Desulfosporosinus sp. BICA1-9]HBW35697.1 GTPase ObgE [Desulfosporosinus sp.]